MFTPCDVFDSPTAMLFETEIPSGYRPSGEFRNPRIGEYFMGHKGLVKAQIDYKTPWVILEKVPVTDIVEVGGKVRIGDIDCRVVLVDADTAILVSVADGGTMTFCAGFFGEPEIIELIPREREGGSAEDRAFVLVEDIIEATLDEYEVIALG